MPVTQILSAEGKKANKSSYRRRKDQNSEIGELEALLPWSQKGAGIDKISVLRLTSTFIKFREFWESIADDYKGSTKKPFPGIERLFSEAIDGFLIILSSSGEVLYVSEGVADYVGVTQQEIIGLPIYELTHCDDHQSIRENLKAKGIKPRQFRQFYIRFKSSISPAKKQLSKFGGTIMLQVSGNLKISQRRHQYIVSGLVAECRRIESSSSILEVSIPQVTFTSTTTLDLKIVSLDTKMSRITGFSNDIKGSMLTDFFHPSDNRRSIHCLKLLLITGQADSPIIRFMTHTGEWVWVQIQGLLRYEKDNKTPKYLEATFKLMCSSGDSLTMIEQKELYANVGEGEENAGIHADSRFKIPSKPAIAKAEDIVKGIQETDVSPAVCDVILHGREEALRTLPMNLDRLAKWEEVVDAVVEYEVSNGLPPNYTRPYPKPPPKFPALPSLPSTSSPLSSGSPLSSTSPGSSVPLAHVADTSPFSTPEPAIDLCESRDIPTNQSPESMATSFDSYIPSSNPMMGNLTQQMINQSSVPTTGAGLHGSISPTATGVPSTYADPITSTKAGLGMPLHGSQATMAMMTSQSNEMGIMKGGVSSGGSLQFNEAGAIANQYNGLNVTATQFNGPNTIASQYNGPHATAHQYNNYSNTLATQHNGPHTNATQFNTGPGVIASQYNNGTGCVANQYNDHNLLASQMNGSNVIGTQYNGANVAATQFNTNGGMGSQFNGPSSQGFQYNSDPQQINPTPPSYNNSNGVNVVANQYIGVQPPPQQQQQQPQYNVGMTPFNAHYNGAPPMQQSPVINMNVTINIPQSNNVPPSHPSFTDQKPVPSKLSHFPGDLPYNGGHVGKVESPMNNACTPYNVQGTFEVSQNWNPAAAHQNGVGFTVNDADDILEALQLM